jgi:hypothetical protein
MEELYRQGKAATFDAAQELTEKLEERNYFAPSERNIYKMLLLSEYQLFLEDKAKIAKNEQPRE